MPAIDPAWIALVGTLCGGLGLKVVEHWLGKSKDKSDEATKLRNELREQIDDLRKEIKDLELERDQYRNDYYDLRDKYVAQTTELTLALSDIKKQAETAQNAAKSIERQPPPVV